MRRPSEFLPSRYYRVVRCTIVGYSGRRSDLGGSSRKAVSVKADPRLPGAEAEPQAVAESLPATVTVDSRFSLMQRTIDGAWLVQERFEESLASGLTVERRFVRGTPRCLDDTLAWLADAGVERALLLQIRTRLTPEGDRLRLVSPSLA